MAAEDKKINSLTEWVYSNIVDAANIVVAHAGGNYRIAMSAIRQYVLGNRTIGGTGSRDIVTIGDEQILMHKRIDEPSFNTDTPTLSGNITATQMNHLSGLVQNVQGTFNSIGSDILTIENRIDGLDSNTRLLQADKIYSAKHTAGGTSIVLGSRAIDSNNEIDPESLSISVYEYSFGTQGTLKLLNLSGIVVSKSGSNLSNVVIANVTAGMTYQIVIRYRLAEQ